MTNRPPHPPIDPEVLAQAVFPPGFSPSLWPERIEQRRADAVPIDYDAIRARGIDVQWRTVPGPADNPELTVLILRPTTAASPDAGAAPGDGPTAGPATAGSAAAGASGIYWVHGGGMVMGNAGNIDVTVIDAVADLGAVVVSVEYRLAPEHPHPAPVDDCFAGLRWTAANAAELGIDPGRLLIAGASAGGGLAAATALLARDRSGPALTHQVLYCPMLDDRERYPSSTELDGEASWDRNANRTGWAALLGDAVGGPDVPAYAAPGRATDLTGLPATFIDVGTVETFRDEDIDYAVRLSQAAVPVELHVWPGGIHGFPSLAPDAEISRGCLSTRRDYLRRALTPDRPAEATVSAPATAASAASAASATPAASTTPAAPTNELTARSGDHG